MRVSAHLVVALIELMGQATPGSRLHMIVRKTTLMGQGIQIVGGQGGKSRYEVAVGISVTGRRRGGCWCRYGYSVV